MVAVIVALLLIWLMLGVIGAVIKGSFGWPSSRPCCSLSPG
jgi:hypothetical protein